MLRSLLLTDTKGLLRSKDKNAAAAQEEENDVFNEEDLAELNAVRMQRGKPPLNRFARFGRPQDGSHNGNGTQSSKSKTIICRCCKNMGHKQKECHKRIRENGKMVDPQGTPYTTRTNEIFCKSSRENPNQYRI